MTWASIVADPRPVSAVSTVKIEPEPKTTISTTDANDVENAIVQIESLSVEDSRSMESSMKEEGVNTDETSNVGHGWGSSAPFEDIEENMNPTGNQYIQFCIDNKDAILDLHSSVVWTKVFELRCDSCERYFKHCMFSNKERKAFSGYSFCRWCQFDGSMGSNASEFSIHRHLHCNRGGKKECGSAWGLNLVRPKPEVEDIMEGNGLADVKAPEVVVKIVPKKMSQKEKRRLDKEAREMSGQ
ncbi:hypothetical protein BKA65DRAFT_555462 [Rhexocercosporidium sp. MPI-PUGE-AT-0058]|nr:hypothetical protein BKA65DRAFT_555462 [Rhexocercosporidium sp. MPI-PUGE-AT-0058]